MDNIIAQKVLDEVEEALQKIFDRYGMDGGIAREKKVGTASLSFYVRGIERNGGDGMSPAEKEYRRKANLKGIPADSFLLEFWYKGRKYRAANINEYAKTLPLIAKCLPSGGEVKPRRTQDLIRAIEAAISRREREEKQKECKDL